MTQKIAYVCSHVFEDTRPILLVSHSGGDWQFLCGGEHKKAELPVLIGMNHILDRDPTILEVLKIPIDHDAERENVDSKWIVTTETPKS